MEKLLEKLSNALGVSGNEKEVMNIIFKEIRPYVDEIKIDKLGSLICRKKGSGKPIMLVAHMDEIGLLIRDIDKEGRIYFSLIGGISEKTLVSQTVHVMAKKRVHGVVTYKDLELGFEKSGTPFPRYTEMYVDTGLTKKELEKFGIGIGDYMIPERKLDFLGNEKIVSGKALDDRVGCFVLLELAKRMKKTKQELYYIFTVQEEMGLYGAKTSIHQIDPALSIVVDATNANEYKDAGVVFGCGPYITIKDLDFLSHRNIVDSLVSVAKKKKIPYQLEVSDTGTTDASTISMSKGGIPTGILSIPLKNIHSTVSVAHMGDIMATVDLLEEFLKNPPKIV